MIQDVVNGANNRRSNKGTEVSFETTTESAQDIATEILKNSINIPPTGYVNQGTEIMIFVARDVDFSGVYENVTVSNRY
jgi:type IV secretion system protein VirB10